MLLSTQTQEPLLYQAADCLRKEPQNRYSNCENPVILCFRLEVTSYSSSGSLHYTPQLVRGTENPAAKRPLFSNILKEKHRLLERKELSGPLSPVLCCHRHVPCDLFQKSNHFIIKIQLFHPYYFYKNIFLILISSMGINFQLSVSVYSQILYNSFIKTLSFNLSLTNVYSPDIFIDHTIVLLDSLCFIMLNNPSSFNILS